MKVEKRTIALAFCSLFVVLSGIFVIGDYQNHNGDFGQYFLHARNIIEGRPWDYLLIGKPAVLPGYPVLLASITWFVGLDAYWIGLANSILWAGACCLAYDYYAGRFYSSYSSLAFLVITLFSPLVIYFQQDGQPNILFAFSFILAIWASRSWDVRDPKIYEIALLMLAAVVRLESIALYGSIAIFLLLKRRYVSAAIASFGAVLTISLDLALAHFYGVSSNFSVGAKVGSHAAGPSFSPISFASNYLIIFSGYILSISETLAPRELIRPLAYEISSNFGLRVPFSTGHVAVAFALVASFISVRPRFTADRVAFLAHISILSSFMLLGLPHRYLIPIVPIAAYYIVSGLEDLLVRALPRPSLLFGALLVGAVSLGLHNFNTYKDVPRSANSLRTPDAEEMAAWVAQAQNGRIVGYWKDRLMQVLLDVAGGDPSKVVGIRTEKQVVGLLERGGLMVLMVKPPVQASLQAFLEESADAKEIWRNSTFVVYGPDN